MNALRSVVSPFDQDGHTASPQSYAVFGSVIDGMDVVDQIALSTTSTVGGYADAPLEPTVINSVTVSE